MSSSSTGLGSFHETHPVKINILPCRIVNLDKIAGRESRACSDLDLGDLEIVYRHGSSGYKKQYRKSKKNQFHRLCQLLDVNYQICLIPICAFLVSFACLPPE